MPELHPVHIRYTSYAQVRVRGVPEDLCRFNPFDRLPPSVESAHALHSTGLTRWSAPASRWTCVLITRLRERGARNRCRRRRGMRLTRAPDRTGAARQQMDTVGVYFLFVCFLFLFLFFSIREIISYIFIYHLSSVIFQNKKKKKNDDNEILTFNIKSLRSL